MFYYRIYSGAEMVITANGKNYDVIRLLGKGKGGYSYLSVNLEGKKVVVKKIHHEPCSYYSFGNKILAELNDYNRLKTTKILMPELIDIDVENEVVIKEYIEGETIFDLVLRDKMKDCYLKQISETARKVYNYGLNIDYFPTNFVVKNDLIYYVDYECNEYSDEWNFENWGVKYWSKTEEFLKYIKDKG